MILTKRAIELISDPEIRRELSDKRVLKCTDQTIVRHIKRNRNNGPLTTAGALKRIKELTGLSDAEILEEVPIEEALQN